MTRMKKETLTVEQALENAKALGTKALERAVVDVLPCPRCDEQLTTLNRSILQDGRVIHIGCKVADKQLESKKKTAAPVADEVMVPMIDHAGRTVLRLDRQGTTTLYVSTADLETGLVLHYDPTSLFEKLYKPIEGYPLKKAVKHFISCACKSGATQDVLDWLGRVVPLTKEEVDMATKKKAEKTNAGKGGKEKSARKPGSGARIRELILKGVDPEKILATIHKEFPGSKAKASDISWNKGKLRKEGVKIPGDDKK